MAQVLTHGPSGPVNTRLPITVSPIENGGMRSKAMIVGLILGLLTAGGGGYFIGTYRYADSVVVPSPHTSEAELPADAGIVTLDTAQQASSGVRCEPATVGVLQDQVWRTGTVRLDQDRIAHLTAPVDGLVREVVAGYGMTVRAGEVLAVIDSKDIGRAKLDLANARLALTAALSRHEWTTQITANARDLWAELDAGKSVTTVQKAFRDRPTGVWRDRLITAHSKAAQLRAVADDLIILQAGTVPETTVRKAKAEAEAAEAQYRAMFEEARFQMAQDAMAAEQAYREAKSAADTARAHLLMYGFTPVEVDAMDPAKEGAAVSHYPIRALFDGTVVEKHAVRGERVTAGHQLFLVADLGTVWVETDVFETDLPLVRDLAGKRVVFRAPTAGIKEREGAVHYLGQVIDPDTRALPLVLTVDNADRTLKPGLFVEVGLVRGGGDEVLSVPTVAVQRHENRTFVFVRTGEGTYRRVDVVLGREASARVEVVSGLQPGNELAVEGTFALKTVLLKDQIGGE